VFSNLFSITLPNIGKYFPGIHFPKGNYFPANKRGLRQEEREEGRENKEMKERKGRKRKIKAIPGCFK